jgi:hypothetical protein
MVKYLRWTFDVARVPRRSVVVLVSGRLAGRQEHQLEVVAWFVVEVRVTVVEMAAEKDFILSSKLPKVRSAGGRCGYLSYT